MSDIDAGQVFHLLGRSWDVTAGLRLARGQQPRQVDVRAAAALLPFIGVDLGHVEHVDLTEPILLGTTDDGLLPLDGWHRIAKASKNTIDRLPAVVLSAEQTRQIEL
jgi:hypothetical protein